MNTSLGSYREDKGLAREEVRKQFRLAELLRPELAELEPHEPIPGERSLAERFGVSRVTIRQALSLLLEDGLIYTVHGAGSFVAPARVTKQMKLLSFSDEMKIRGLIPSSKVLNMELVQAEDERAIEESIVLSKPTFRIERIRYGNNEPMSLEVTYIEQSIAPNLADFDLTQSLYVILDSHFGIEVVSAEEHLVPIVANAAQSVALNIEPGSAAISIYRTGFNVRGKEVERSFAIRRGDRWDFKYTIRI